MKPGTVNQTPEWTFVFPDSIADWDAITGWEKARLASMQTHLKPGMVLYDIGTEHGWLSAVYGAFAGYENMVLIEPSPEMWVNIRKTWEANGFPAPMACLPMFAGAIHDLPGLPGECADWPAWTHDWATLPETGAMPYRYMGEGHAIRTTTVDQIADIFAPPAALTIDVEGFELGVLHGAHRTLEEHRPLVWVSVHPDLMERQGTTPEQLYAFMGSLNYHRDLLGIDHEEHHLFTPKEH